jgi:hypothetical protein
LIERKKRESGREGESMEFREDSDSDEKQNHHVFFQYCSDIEREIIKNLGFRDRARDCTVHLRA